MTMLCEDSVRASLVLFPGFGHLQFVCEGGDDTSVEVVRRRQHVCALQSARYVPCIYVPCSDLTSNANMKTKITCSLMHL